MENTDELIDLRRLSQRELLILLHTKMNEVEKVQQEHTATLQAIAIERATEKGKMKVVGAISGFISGLITAIVAAIATGAKH